MKKTTKAMILTVACIGTWASAKAAVCNITGPFTDSLGSSGTFTTQKKGTASNANICPVPYNLTVTKLTTTIFNIKGKPQSGTCGALTGKFKFQNGGCEVAVGTITIAGLGTFNDTVTDKGKIVTRPTADQSALTKGLH